MPMVEWEVYLIFRKLWTTSWNSPPRAHHGSDLPHCLDGNESVAVAVDGTFLYAQINIASSSRGNNACSSHPTTNRAHVLKTSSRTSKRARKTFITSCRQMLQRNERTGRGYHEGFRLMVAGETGSQGRILFCFCPEKGGNAYIVRTVSVECVRVEANLGTRVTNAWSETGAWGTGGTGGRGILHIPFVV